MVIVGAASRPRPVPLSSTPVMLSLSKHLWRWYQPATQPLARQGWSYGEARMQMGTTWKGLLSRGSDQIPSSHGAQRQMRESENTTHNDVLRRILELPQTRSVSSPVSQVIGRTFIADGVEFPHGTEFRMRHKGRWFTAKTSDGSRSERKRVQFGQQTRL